MSFLCSISGVPPEEPCLSKTGYVFERRLIEKHLEESQVCPATGEPLTLQDLIPIKDSSIVKPRHNTANSIPGLLSLLQSEWDALALETHGLRAHVDEVRKQLSFSLYQHDAATRVIARLIKQRDRALSEVESLKEQLVQFRANYDVNALEIGLDEPALERIQQLAKLLLADRKKRDLSNYSNPEKLGGFKCRGEYRVHSSTVPGVSCVTLDRSVQSEGLEDSFCFSGGNDGSIVYFDVANQKTASVLNGHVKRVNALLSHNADRILLSGADDKLIKVWKEFDNEFKCVSVFKHHKAPVKCLSLHPSGEYFLSLCSDGVWSLNELDSCKIVKMFKDVPKCSALKFHPDGLIALGCSSGSLHIWDVRESSLKDPLTADGATVNGTTNGAGESNWVDLDVSENGYYLASATDGGVVSLWDLRKQKVVATADCNVNVTRVKFDQSGNYLGVASTKVELLEVNRANLSSLGVLEGHTGPVTDLEFGPFSRFILTTSMDKSLRLFY
ncbi:RING-type E3 ubiquitin transferase [Theileria orientalis]|uniref:Pre-mRNA-processing factor 19 n=1 Tax=Theileria orientalis TaxID=68886 RepID=A0A976MDX8_THEOR|nr:RING-type E3 ubiquitin transferase [Theileria orientalis]